MDMYHNQFAKHPLGPMSSIFSGRAPGNIPQNCIDLTEAEVITY